VYEVLHLSTQTIYTGSSQAILLALIAASSFNFNCVFKSPAHSATPHLGLV